MNLYVYCEGQTEFRFIKDVLYPYLLNSGVYAIPLVCTTKRTKTEKFKGGVSDYFKIKYELSVLCKQHKNEIITTMFDYYGFPSNTPGFKDASGSLYKKVIHIEKAIDADIGMPNLFFNLIVHEFEGLLFADTSAFKTIADDDVVTQLQSVRADFESPEYINNSSDTAPSRRIKTLIPNYAKVLDGANLSARIGINAMLVECRHFSEWVQKICSL